MNNMQGEELLQELYKVADIDEKFIENGTLCNNELEVVAELKDIINDDEKIRLAIFQVTYRGYSIIPF